MVKLLWLIITRDVRLSVRHGSATTMVMGFFVIVVTLFPFAIGPEQNILERISVGVIWVAALLSCLLSLDRMFQTDYEDGSLDQFLLSPVPLEAVVVAKCIAHWLSTAVPLILLTPVLGVMMNLPEEGFLPLLGVMLLGTPALSFIGGIGAALTVTLRRGGVLLSLLILPLYIPVLIFGVLAVKASIDGYPAMGHVMLLGGFTLFSAAIAPWAAAAAIRSGLE
ncbi:heme exporter protein CcmB [Paremcibacter congregatus]|uniref:Heme exporter protein B n=1 Tax=Paremcibacter congregatus TaxID=2043170 RepID=A0A2G4YQH0_9PROT|nr:heme exporter protein CcmB [Paremcibacter congregatus]PHZ84520.1 heme exporter protein CcmB [Paremcibacter congregatus]QDE28739.1 heme exporter protein CcmB [Paremcibacter congregatus]